MPARVRLQAPVAYRPPHVASTRGPYADVVMADGPLLYWRLDEPTPGTGTAADSSGNGRTGTYAASPTQAASLLGTDPDASVVFNGSTQWVTSAYNPFATGVGRTFECWFKRTSSSTADAMMGSDNVSNPVIFRADSAATTVSIWVDGSSAAQTWTGTLVSVGTTVHLAFTFNGSTKVGELFVNGVSQGTKTFATDYNATPGNFTVARRGSGQDPCDGTLDEVAIYGTVLSAARILAHYNAGALVAAPVKTFDVQIAGLGTLVPATLVRTRSGGVTVAGLGTVSPNFVRQNRVLAATVAGTGTVTVPYLARSRPLAAVISGLGAVTVTRLAVTRTIAATIAGLGTVTTNFVRANRVFRATIAGVGTLAADITTTGAVIKAFAAVIAGTGTVAVVTVRTRGLQATVAGTGALVAAASRFRGFAATVAGTGAVTASYVRNKRVLNAAISGLGQVSPDFGIVGKVTLAVVIAGQGAVTAAYVRNKRVLASVVAGTGTVTVMLGRVRTFAAAVAGTGAVQAVVVRTRRLAATIAGVGQLAGDLVTFATLAPPYLEGLGRAVARLTSALGMTRHDVNGSSSSTDADLDAETLEGAGRSKGGLEG